MRIVEQHIIHDNRFAPWCVKAKNLYNQVLYYWRQSVFGNIQYFSEYEIVELFREYNEENFRALPSTTSQQIIKFLFSNIKSWQRSKKQYDKNPSKFLGRPRMPNYKKEMSELHFTGGNQLRFKNGFIHFPEMLGITPMKTNISSVNHCRVIPKSNHWVVEFIYTVEEKPMQEYNGNWMGCDIGLNNIIACISNVAPSFIVNGKPLKAINHFYNKRKAKLQSQLKKDTHTSKRIERLTFKRNQRIKDYLHKASKLIVTTAKENNITKIIIGKNDGWKQNVNLGKNINRQFTSIPHATLIEKIKYKAQMEGIEVIAREESYTSKCSALDLEPIQKHETYLGKRKKRGLFVTKGGTLINADCNGAANSARKELISVSGKDITISDFVRSAAVAPKKVNISHNGILSLKSS